MPNPAQSSHPGLPQLSAYAQGKLADAERDSVETHLRECPACRDALAALPGGSESLRGSETLETVRAAKKVPSPGQETTAFHPERPVPAGLANHPRYELLQLLGEGGMGAVYKARHKVMNRLVALKVLNARLVGNASAIERFHREVQAAAKLDHPNIVRAHDADQAGETHFLVMEYVNGIDLAKLLEKRGRVNAAHASHFIRQAALGLQHAHEHGMVHRDIKPHNLMLMPANVVKVMDFGLARLGGEQVSATGLTGENVLLGTADYIAPEQARDAHAADIRADIYSLGCSLYHLLAGRPPFPGGSVVQKIAAHLTAAPSLAALPATVPERLRGILAKMMEKDPAQRYQTPGQVVQALLPPAVSGQRSETAAAPAPMKESREQAALAARRPAVTDVEPMTPALSAPRSAARSSIKRRRRRRRSLAPLLVLAAAALVSVLVAGFAALHLLRKESPAAVTDNASSPAEDRASAKTATAPPNENVPRPLVAPFDETIAKEGQKQWADHLATPVELTNSIGMKLALIPAGEFTMGSTPDQIATVLSWVSPLVHKKLNPQSEQPAHRVKIVRPFYLGIHEVTRGQFGTFVGATGYKTDAERDGRRPAQEFDSANGRNLDWLQPGYPQTDDHPVVNVSAADAVAFCEWLSRKEGRSYRLPREAEWEHACRAGTTTLFYTGDDRQKAAEVVNTNGPTDRFEFTAPVASFPANPFGLYDMYGNVWEMCQDRGTPDYVGHSAEDEPPASADPAVGIARGGAADCPIWYCRSANRNIGPRIAVSNNLGFRIACEALQVRP